MRIATDNNIFLLQKYGGISRIFHDYLSRGVINSKIELTDVRPRLTIRQRILRKLGLFEPIKERTQNEIIDTCGCDLYHPSYYGNFNPDNLRTPYVITVHDMIHEIFPEIFNINSTTNEKYKLLPGAKRLIAISETTKQDIIKIMGLPGDNIDVVPLYTTFNIIESKPVSSNIPANYVLFVGGRNQYKNFKRFVQAMSLLIWKYDNLEVVCTGQGFSNVEKVFFDSLGINNKMHNVFCEDDHMLKFLYEKANCFVFPSLYEGFGFPLLEAFASRCPVVASNAGSLPEVGSDACVYFDPFDINDMANKIELVLANNELKSELVNKGKIRLKDYSIEITMELTLKTYKKTLDPSLL